MAVRLLSPSSFAFNDSNYDNTNANAGSRSHLGIKNLKRRKPHLLVKNDDSNGVGCFYGGCDKEHARENEGNDGGLYDSYGQRNAIHGCVLL